MGYESVRVQEEIQQDHYQNDHQILSRRNFFKGAMQGTIAVGAASTFVTQAEAGPKWGDFPREKYFEKGSTEDVVLNTQRYYPYSRSTLEIFAELEKRFFPDEKYIDHSLVIGDNIANRVADRMRRAFDRTETMPWQKVSKWINAAPDNLKIYVDKIAHEFYLSGCEYGVESSLHDGVNPEWHNNWYHLDCDLLCHFGMHAASRHDVSLNLVTAPGHMYLTSNRFPELAFEMTAFEPRTPNQTHGPFSFVQTTQKEVKKYFEEQSKEKILPEHFHALRTKEEVMISIIANLIMEGKDRIFSLQSGETLERICRLADRELAKYKSGPYLPAMMYYCHASARDHYLSMLENGNGNENTRRWGIYHAEMIAWLKNNYRQWIDKMYDKDDQWCATMLQDTQVASQEF